MKIFAALIMCPLALLMAVATIGGGTETQLTFTAHQLSTTAVCGDIPAILATIRTLESGDNYTEQHRAKITGYAKGSGWPSGAYQFIYSTWNHYAGYDEAFQAPPTIQDERATTDVTNILDALGSVEWVPIAWYIGTQRAVKAKNGEIPLDWIPNPEHNTISIGAYQTRWMTQYQTQTTSNACATTQPTIGNYALPLPAGNLTVALLARPHHDYPAIDIPVPTGTPVYAPVTGTITTLTNTTSTWYNPGGTSCTPTPTRPCQACGIGLRIQDTTGNEWSICHLSNRTTTTIGQTITAGQLIGASGNTGHSSGPHLHYGIRNPNGTTVCPQTFLQALYNNTTPPTPATLPTSGCTT